MATPFNKTYGQIFEELLPHYLAIGMPYELYWNGDSKDVKAYREAHKMKTDMNNQQSWLQGAYFYQALCAASPIFHDFAKKGTKAQPYMEEPFALNDMQKKRIEDKKEKANYDKSKAFMEAFMVSNNKKYD